jgi:hypothetical protein
MAVYVDNVRIRWRGKLWCHLVADSLEELHSFAQLLGLKRHWFQDAASYPHYDVTVEIRQRALRVGALKGSRVTIITCARSMKAELLREHKKQSPQLSLFCSLMTAAD